MSWEPVLVLTNQAHGRLRYGVSLCCGSVAFSVPCLLLCKDSIVCTDCWPALNAQRCCSRFWWLSLVSAEGAGWRAVCLQSNKAVAVEASVQQYES